MGIARGGLAMILSSLLFTKPPWEFPLGGFVV